MNCKDREWTNLFFKWALFFLYLLVLPPHLQAKASKKCHFEFSKEKPKLTWTAYKTSKKLPVNGSFRDIEITKEKAKAPSYNSIEKLLLASHFSINAKSVDTDNTARDKTLVDHFFSLMKSSLDFMPGEIFIHGKVKDLNLKSKRLTSHLHLNGIKKEMAFQVQHLELEQKEKKEVGKTHLLKVEGSLNLFDFGLKEAHESLHEACKELHKGEDGVSKTWSDVYLQGEIQIEEKCF